MSNDALAISRQASPATVLPGEHGDLLLTLNKHRDFLRFTARDLTDDQARSTPTVSALSIGGLIKHVSFMEEVWSAFMVGGADAMNAIEHKSDWASGYKMVESESLEGLLATYATVADATGAFLATLPDLDVSHPLPVAPWFEPGASWSVRRVLLHLIAETSQHAGHADIIRETIDGAKTMG